MTMPSLRTRPDSALRRPRHSRLRLVSMAVVVGVVPIGMQVPASASPRVAHSQATSLQLNLTTGTPNPAEPSALGPPPADALAGYTQSNVTNFTGTSLPAGWDVFTGIPGGDPGGHFGVSHVVVANGVMSLNTYRDPAWQNNWVTGGVCQCGVARRYGAYFVRSRVSGAGPTEVELLWPANNTWPPEIDFNETGGSIVSTSSSVHFGAANNIVRRKVNVNMTTWHTWGVIWASHKVTYTVDGRVWGVFNAASDIPSLPMTLDFEQRQECEENRQCPTAPESMQVAWVAEYSK
jgi:hypothetical protein